MAAARKTGFDKYFEKRMEEPSFAAEYTKARAAIDATDQLIRALDAVRTCQDLTKTELARRINAKPALVRRLLTATDSNPTMSTVFKVTSALGYHLELVANPAPVAGRKVATHAQALRRSRG
jgi:DNA-binding phage protein